jgi:hypothetical protein
MAVLIIIVGIVFTSTLFFIGWLIGYPIYRICKREPVFYDSNYALGLYLPSLVVAVCSLIIQIMAIMGQ